jgi:hypothetical protein
VVAIATARLSLAARPPLRLRQAEHLERVEDAGRLGYRLTGAGREYLESTEGGPDAV